MSLAFAVPTFAVWCDELWDTILDLSALLPVGSWVLIGGQAVTAHSLAQAAAAGPGRDVDAVGRIVVTEASMPMVRHTFRDLGFTTANAAPTSDLRFSRDADDSGSSALPQVWTVHVAGSTSLLGADRALENREPYQVTKGLRAPCVPVPTLAATIVYEAARFARETETPFRHARDAAFLTSRLDDPRDARERMSGTDRYTLSALDAAVGNPDHHVWTRLADPYSAHARWRALTRA